MRLFSSIKLHLLSLDIQLNAWPFGKENNLILDGFLLQSMALNPPSLPLHPIGTACSHSSDTDVILLSPHLLLLLFHPPLLSPHCCPLPLAARCHQHHHQQQTFGEQIQDCGQISCAHPASRGHFLGNIRGVLRCLQGPSFECFYFFASLFVWTVWILQCRFAGAEEPHLTVKAAGQTRICGAFK